MNDDNRQGSPRASLLRPVELGLFTSALRARPMLAPQLNQLAAGLAVRELVSTLLYAFWHCQSS
jgi:hypothetical protein